MTLALPKRGFGDFTNAAMTLLANAQGVFGWGNNTTGTLAVGIAVANSVPLQQTLFDPNTTVPPSDSTIMDIAFTNANLYLVFSNGWVYSAGQNNFGQLGHGDTTARPYLKRIEYFVTNNLTVQQVWAAGAVANTDGGGCVYFQTLAGSTPGLYACGLNTIGNLGNAADPTTNLTTPDICAGIDSSATVTDVVVSSITAANFSAYVLRSDGSVLVAGYNVQGQLGTGTNTSVSGTFVNALASTGGNLSNVISISATGSAGDGGSALALDSSGNVWTTGYNVAGQLGQNDTTNRNKFTPISNSGSPGFPAGTVISQAGMGGGYYAYCYAIDSTGILYTWGHNGQNNLFKGNSTTPVKAPTTTVFPAGYVASIFFPRDEALSNTGGQMIAVTSSGTQLTYSGVGLGQNGIANPTYSGTYLILLPILASGETIDGVFVHGTATTQRIFVHTTSGNVFSFGANADSICTGGYSSNTMPTTVDGFNIASVVPSIPLI